MSGADLQIAADGAVVFRYAGCLDRGEFRARGVVQGRVLVLDKSVHDYLGEPFSSFHYRRVGVCEFLVAAPRRETFDRFVRERENGEDARTLDSTFTLRRIPPKPVLEDRLLRCEDPEEQERLFEDWDKHALAPGDYAFLAKIVDSPAHDDLQGRAISAMVHIGYDGLLNEIAEGPAVALREDAQSKFLKMLREHPDAEVRRLIADRLTDDTNLTDIAAFAESDLRRAWKVDPDERVRLQAAFGLAILKKREVVPFLLEALPRLKSKNDRYVALLSLALNDASEAVELFEKEIEAGRLDSRAEFLRVLGRLKSVRSIPVVIGVARKPPGVLDRNTAVWVLEEIGSYTPEVRAALLEVMRSDDRLYVRIKAAGVLAALSPKAEPEAVPLIREIYKAAKAEGHSKESLDEIRELERKFSQLR